MSKRALPTPYPTFFTHYSHIPSFFPHSELLPMPSTATIPTSLTARIHELVSACFTGIWLETCEPEGAVSMKTTGFTGGSCREATRELERALGHEWTGEPAAGFLCQKRQLRADSAEGLKEQGRATDWDKGQRAQGL